MLTGKEIFEWNLPADMIEKFNELFKQENDKKSQDNKKSNE
jgi:hypothetical protein